MLWWWWVLIGFGLMVIEVVTPGGFISLFFGVSAILVGILVGTDLIATTWIGWAWFSVISLALIVTLRSPLQRRLDRSTRKNGPVDSMVGEVASVLVLVTPSAPGRVEARGATWTARTRGTATIAIGQRCRIEEVDGLTLWVRAE